MINELMPLALGLTKNNFLDKKKKRVGKQKRVNADERSKHSIKFHSIVESDTLRLASETQSITDST